MTAPRYLGAGPIAAIPDATYMECGTLVPLFFHLEKRELTIRTRKSMTAPRYLGVGPIAAIPAATYMECGTLVPLFFHLEKAGVDNPNEKVDDRTALLRGRPHCRDPGRDLYGVR